MTRRSSRRRTGLFFPLLLVAIGILFLLANLDLIGRDVWQQVWRLWPVLLILLGFDLLGGRGSIGGALAALVGILVLVGAAFALFHLFAPDTWVTDVQSLSQPLAGASSASLALSCTSCSMEISGRATESMLVEGTVSLRRDDRLSQSVQRSGSALVYGLQSEPYLPFLLTASQGEHVWNLRLNGEIPIDLSVEAGKNLTLDLRLLQVERANLTVEEGTTVITLPTSGHALLYVDGNTLRVRVPEGVAVRLLGSTAEPFVLPSGYARLEDGAQSPDYEAAETQVEILLLPGMQRVVVDQLSVEKTADSDTPEG